MAETQKQADLDRELSIWELLGASFRIQSRWMVIVAWIEAILFTVVMVCAAVRFFQVDTVRRQIMYATVFLTCGLINVLVKVWYWMLINRVAVTHHVKRLERRIEELCGK